MTIIPISINVKIASVSALSWSASDATRAIKIKPYITRCPARVSNQLDIASSLGLFCISRGSLLREGHDHKNNIKEGVTGVKKKKGRCIDGGFSLRFDLERGLIAIRSSCTMWLNNSTLRCFVIETSVAERNTPILYSGLSSIFVASFSTMGYVELHVRAFWNGCIYWQRWIYLYTTCLSRNVNNLQGYCVRRPVLCFCGSTFLWTSVFVILRSTSDTTPISPSK